MDGTINSYMWGFITSLISYRFVVFTFNEEYYIQLTSQEPI